MRTSHERLHRFLPALILTGACSPSMYEQPSPQEPHAIVKVRIVHHSRPGPQLSQEVTANGFAIAAPVGSVRALRVRPEPAAWSFSTHYFHTITRPVLQHYTESQSYPCGTTTSRIGSTTSTQTRYCTRYVPRTRTVYQTTTVTDAACETGGRFFPQVGGVYLVQYDFYSHGMCRATCFRQWPQPDGTFRNTFCEAPPPPS